jgi:hypothetical protein
MKKALYIFIFTIIATSAMAQSSMMSWQYSMGFATGNLKEYTSPVSFRGVTYNYSKMVESGAAIGLELGWNVFYEEKGYGTYTTGNVDYSGKQWRYSNNAPILFTISYFKNPDENVSPFAGIGVGTMYSERRTTMGAYNFTADG